MTEAATVTPEQEARWKRMVAVVRGSPEEDEARMRARERIRLEERDAHEARKKQGRGAAADPVLARQLLALERLGLQQRGELLQLFDRHGKELRALHDYQREEVKANPMDYQQRAAESAALRAQHDREREALRQIHATARAEIGRQ